MIVVGVLDGWLIRHSLVELLHVVDHDVMMMMIVFVWNDDDGRVTRVVLTCLFPPFEI
jgi:hypothetical protein